MYGNPRVVPVSEDSQLDPVSPYGTSKWMTELMLSDAAASCDMQFAILRYFNVAGADPSLRSGQNSRKATHLIKRAAQAVLRPDPVIDVFGSDYETADGTCVRDYIHVSDLADIHVAVLDCLERDNRSMTLNCGYGRGYSVLDVISAVMRATRTPITIKKVGRRPGDPAVLVAETSKLRSTIDWAPRHDDIDAIVRDAIAWERKVMGVT